MKLRDDRVFHRPAVNDPSNSVPARVSREERESPLIKEVLSALPGGRPRFVSQAPGRLDVLGGIAEYTGSLVLTMAVAEHVCVAVECRDDDTICIGPGGAVYGNGSHPLVVPLQALRAARGGPVDAKRGRELVAGSENEAVRCVFAAAVELLRTGLIRELGGGVSIAIGSALGKVTSAGRSAAMAAATVTALARAKGLRLEASDAVALCRRVENDWLEAPVGEADAACVLLGEPNSVLSLRCNPFTLSQRIPLPEDLVFVGVDCGVVYPQAMCKYRQIRTASFMGRALIDRIVRHEDDPHARWDGNLAQVTISDYVERFRDRLPTKMKGRDYLDRFGETGDPLTRIDPSFLYKIRSRTEHHVYEHARAVQFSKCLSNFTEKRDGRALIEAGELMYASHWSYGQRCGLGTVETDFLVHLIRGYGVRANLYGAKVGGRGCGDVVTVMLREGPGAMGALDRVLEEYQSRTGHTPTLLKGSSPGALVAGVRQM